jgi:hypothetical protein
MKSNRTTKKPNIGSIIILTKILSIYYNKKFKRMIIEMKFVQMILHFQKEINVCTLLKKNLN